MRETIDWLSKFLALVFVEAVLLTVMLLCGVIMQTVAGYYHYELLQYFKELYLIIFPPVIGFTLLAFFVQTMVSNKFIGHAIVIGMFVLDPDPVPLRHREHAAPARPEPALHLFRHERLRPLRAGAVVVASFIGLAIFAVLACSPSHSRGVAPRMAGVPACGRPARGCPGLAPALLLFALIAIGSGCVVLSTTRTSSTNTSPPSSNARIQAQLRTQLQAIRDTFRSPKMIAVDANIDLDPDHRSFSGSGHFVLQNKTPQADPADTHHRPDAVGLGRAVRPPLPSGEHDAPRSVLHLQLETPLAPGEKLNMTFKVGYQTHGFRDGNERPELAYNGMFFDSSYFPHIGYNTGIELDDPRRRREEKLGLLSDLPPRGDPWGSVTNLFTTDSDWISFHTVVSTPDDQIAFAPGYLQRDWHQNGRHYYAYDMGDVKILDFYAYVSGRYDVKRENYKGVNIEIYHAPAARLRCRRHDGARPRAAWTITRPTTARSSSGSSASWSFRAIGSFAQSFPNTIPFTETFGFFTRVLDPKKDIDFTYFVTAHELAHQWWAHQLIGGHVAGLEHDVGVAGGVFGAAGGAEEVRRAADA